jgi:murein L,D-transpeptidase YcbB/YkuD
VQDPLSLAEFFLDDPTNWSREKINKIVATKMTQTVQLKEQPNVYLLYWTAWTEDNGVVHFRKDIYERNMPLIEQLKASR